MSKAGAAEYACLAHRPTFLIETARGCPYRCSFCSVWQMYDRQFRERGIEGVCRDTAAVGDHVFIADDLFWHHGARSEALATELIRRGLRKQWVLVQSRVDTVARQPALLEAWRPFAREFDVFFGLEAPTDDGLTRLSKDTTVEWMREGIRVAREVGLGVTGNFVIDPAWGEHEFERLWAFVAQERLWQVGFTILTPLPGTAYFNDVRPKLRAREWAQFDMHHLLWEPTLGAERFFELYCETWRRSVLNLRGQKRWWHWLREVEYPQCVVPRPGPSAQPEDARPPALSGRAPPGAVTGLPDGGRGGGRGRRRQNTTRTPSCICRADVIVERIWPNEGSGAVSVPVPLNATSDGGPKLTRLKRLKISARSSTRPPVPSDAHGTDFVKATSTVRRSGPIRSFRPALPNVPIGCSTNAVGSNQRSGSPVTASSGPRPGA